MSEAEAYESSKNSAASEAEQGANGGADSVAGNTNIRQFRNRDWRNVVLQ